MKFSNVLMMLAAIATAAAWSPPRPPTPHPNPRPKPKPLPDRVRRRDVEAAQKLDLLARDLDAIYAREADAFYEELGARDAEPEDEFYFDY